MLQNPFGTKGALLYSPVGRIMRAIVQRTKASLYTRSLGCSITGTEYENPPYDYLIRRSNCFTGTLL